MFVCNYQLREPKWLQQMGMPQPDLGIVKLLGDLLNSKVNVNGYSDVLVANFRIWANKPDHLIQTFQN